MMAVRKLGREPVTASEALAHLDDQRAPVYARRKHLCDAHTVALEGGVEQCRPVHAPHLGALERQFGIAREFDLAVRNAIDELLDRIGEHGLRERGHRLVGAIA